MSRSPLHPPPTTPTAVANTARPLDGLRVVETATLAPGPMAGTALAEYGAVVVKVEQPGAGDPMRTWGDRKNGVAEM